MLEVAATKDVHKRLQCTFRGLGHLIFDIPIEFNLEHLTPAYLPKVKVFPIILARLHNSFVLRKLPIRVPCEATPKLGSVHYLFTGFPINFVDFFVSFEVQYSQGTGRLKLEDKFSLPRV